MTGGRLWIRQCVRKYILLKVLRCWLLQWLRCLCVCICVLDGSVRFLLYSSKSLLYTFANEFYRWIYHWHSSVTHILHEHIHKCIHQYHPNQPPLTQPLSLAIDLNLKCDQIINSLSLFCLGGVGYLSRPDLITFFLSFSLSLSHSFSLTFYLVTFCVPVFVVVVI